MPLDEELLDLLVCPETREKLTLAAPQLVANINAAIEAGRLKTRSGKPLSAPIETGLVRPDGRYLYPVANDIPNLLIDDAIPLEGM